MRFFTVNSKDLFDPKVNPGMSLTAEHAEFVRTLAEAKDEMDMALARGEQPVLDDKKLKLVIDHIRYHQDMPAAYRRDVHKLVAGVLACKTLKAAGSYILKVFRWNETFQGNAELVARAILQFEQKKNEIRLLDSSQQRATLLEVSKSWEKKS